jgi:hypothetical protein
MKRDSDDVLGDICNKSHDEKFIFYTFPLVKPNISVLTHRQTHIYRDPERKAILTEAMQLVAEELM